MDNKFQIGDEVIVINNGSCYNCYELWAKSNNLDFWKEGMCENGDEGIVITMAPHSRLDNFLLYGVFNEKKGSSFIIGEKGIRLKRKKSMLEDELFEI